MTHQSGKTLIAEKYEWLRQIWTDEGSNPRYHRAQQERLRTEWPALYKWMLINFGPPKTGG